MHKYSCQRFLVCLFSVTAAAIRNRLEKDDNGTVRCLFRISSSSIDCWQGVSQCANSSVWWEGMNRQRVLLYQNIIGVWLKLLLLPRNSKTSLHFVHGFRH